MRVGDLVKVTQASIGVPLGTVGLVMSIVTGDSGLAYYRINLPAAWGHRAWAVLGGRRFLARDLEIVNAAR